MRASAGKILVKVPIEKTSCSPTFERGNCTLWEYSIRIPPSAFLRGSAWHLIELHAMVTENLRPPVGLRSGLQVGIAELEHDLGIANRKAVPVRNPPPQDEAAVVKAE